MKDLSDAVARLQEVIATTGMVELNKLARGVIDTLKERSPYDMFEDTLVRNLWDEYCWNYQEGADCLDEPFDDLVAAVVDTAIDKAGTHVLICMTAYSQDQLDSDFHKEELEPGSIDKQVISHVCMDKIKVAAGIRNLDIIGYQRAFVIAEYVAADGLVFSRYDADNLASHVDVLIDPAGDLGPVADEIIERFLSTLSEESRNPDLEDFLDRYNDEVYAMLKAQEVIPALEDVRSELLAELDG